MEVFAPSILLNRVLLLNIIRKHLDFVLSAWGCHTHIHITTHVATKKNRDIRVQSERDAEYKFWAIIAMTWYTHLQWKSAMHLDIAEQNATSTLIIFCLAGTCWNCCGECMLVVNKRHNLIRLGVVHSSELCVAIDCLYSQTRYNDSIQWLSIRVEHSISRSLNTLWFLANFCCWCCQFWRLIQYSKWT